jgi:hypothetical protein
LGTSKIRPAAATAKLQLPPLDAADPMPQYTAGEPVIVGLTEPNVALTVPTVVM